MAQALGGDHRRGVSWTLRKKVLLGYGIVFLLAGVAFGWALVNLLRLGDASGAILSENYRSIIAADHMIDALERQDSGVLLYTLGFEEEGVRQFRENQTEFSRWLARAEDNVTIPGEAEVIRSIDSSYTDYLIAFTHSLQSDDAPIRIRYHEELLPAFRAVREAAGALRLLNEEIMEAASDRAARVARTATWSVTIVGAVTLLLGLAFSLVLTNRLVQPIRRMREASEHVAAGDYDVDVPADSSDELGLLAAEFNEMTARLRSYRDLNIERIVAEQRKGEAIIESIHDGLVIVGAELTIQGMNPAAAEALGVDAGEATGQHFLEAVRSEALFRHVKEAMTSGTAPEIDEEASFFSVERGGVERHYQFVVTPIRTPSRSMLGVILLLRDVTKLRELDRMKSEFVATASHELKTPLTSIGMSIELLQERAYEKLDDRERELLDVASEDVERLRHLVLDLLDLSKIEAGKIELDFAPVSVRGLIGEAVRAMGVQAEKDGVALSSEAAAELPEVRADASKVVWVLTNLIANALRHTDKGGRVELSADRAGSKVHVAVRDTGGGIPYEYQAKIFDKFVQVGGERSVGGSGLGLAICKEIVRAHGGSIWVESVPGQGATFTFTLPVADGSQAA